MKWTEYYCLEVFSLWLACTGTCEETGESVWPPKNLVACRTGVSFYMRQKWDAREGKSAKRNHALLLFFYYFFFFFHALPLSHATRTRLAFASARLNYAIELCLFYRLQVSSQGHAPFPWSLIANQGRQLLEHVRRPISAPTDLDKFKNRR